jgi:S-adenosylmethionine-dependent methyltransferase
MNNIEEYYNCQYDEWGRLERHRIEYEITKKVLNEFIEDNSEVLDVGGGPGRYSIYLAQKGHNVTLVDLSKKLVEQATENASKAGVIIHKFIKGNVLNLETMLPGKHFDAVLCMGPMYHLLEEDERKEGIRQCLKLLKPRGVLIVSFISAYAPIVDCLKAYPHEIKERKVYFLQYLTDGRNNKDSGFTDAYFINPENIEALLSEFELETLRVMAAEGLGAMCENQIMQLSEEDFQEWVDLFYKISDNKVVWGSCEHLLYVGRKVG